MTISEIPPLARKFVRYLDYPSVPAAAYWGMHLRVLYEFWGFCVNGTDDLRHPGGFPTGSSPTTHFSGAINMPTNWESGSTVLMLSGTSGSTTFGSSYFTGSNFTTGMVGKFISLWRSGSSSTDDSIYQIAATAFAPNATTGSIVKVDILMGGTPVGSGNLKLGFTERTDVNYRVIDLVPVAAMSYNIYNFIILVMAGASYVNPGQRNAQVRFRLSNFNGDLLNRGLAILMSPSGSWNGTQFTEGLTGGNSQINNVASNIGEFGPNSGSSSDWLGGGGTGVGTINLWGAQDFVIATTWGAFGNGSCGYHVEIPQRLYPQNKDPNPIAGMGFGSSGHTAGFLDGYSYGFGFYLMTADNKPNKHWVSIHHNFGKSYNTSATSALPNLGSGVYNQVFYNVFTNKFFISDAILGTNATGQHAFARCRLRRVKFIPPIVPAMQRLGDDGEWIHTQTGILLPWDNSLQPRTIFHSGI